MKKTASKKGDFGLKDVAHDVAHPEPEMPYIEKRGNTYTFNRRAPAPLKPGFEFELSGRKVKVGRNGYVRFTLGTSDRKVARARALECAHLLDKVADRLANANQLKTSSNQPSTSAIKVDSLKSPTAEEIQRAAMTMRAALLAADEHVMHSSVSAALAGEVFETEPDRDLVSAFSLPPNNAAGHATLLQQLGQIISFYIYQTTGKAIESVGPEHLPFAYEFRQLVSDLSARSRNESVVAPAIPKPVSEWSWQDALDYYVQQSDLGVKTQSIYRQAWMSLAESAEVPPRDLQHNHVMKWRDNVLRKSVSAGTAKNRMGHVSAIWHASRKARHIPRDTPDPFEDIIIKVSKNRTTSRTQFTRDEMQIIFSAEPPTTASAVSVHAGYWLPVLAAYYGGRLEELVGIEVADVVDEEVGLVFWIRPNSTRPNIKGGKKASRCLPIHPILVELGFLEYLKAAREAGTKRLFPSLSKGATFGELFVEHCRNLLKPAEGRKVGMHCFRHCWETAKRSAEPNFDFSVARYIAGRSIDEGSAALYGSAAGLPKVQSELAKIQYRLKHNPAPPVTAQMLREQEAISIRNKRAGLGRRKNPVP